MTVGERLREARERQKVSLRAIAEKTNISVRFLDAIEKNQFEKLPGGIFTRGFIRSYAMQVGIDPDAAVAHFLSDEPDARDEPDEGPQGQRDGPGLGIVLIAGVVLIVLTLALVWVLAPDWLGSRSSPASSQESTAPLDPATGAIDSTTSPASPGSAATPAAAVSTSVSTAPAPPGARPAASALAGPVPVAATPQSPRAPLHLVVAPSRRCWVQVSADGQMRLAREVAAGDQVVVEAAERLQIVVGDAGAFEYELNGRAGRSLGPAGRVARATILPATVSQFQVQ